jgi:hypothetical protein
MIIYHLCLDCVETETGSPAKELPVSVFNSIKHKLAFIGDVCPICGGVKLTQVFGVETAYIKGYGFTDKKGVKRDMDIHAMTSGRDPYSEHRQMGESRSIVNALQKDREHKKRPKTIHISRK